MYLENALQGLKSCQAYNVAEFFENGKFCSCEHSTFTQFAVVFFLVIPVRYHKKTQAKCEISLYTYIAQARESPKSGSAPLPPHKGPYLGNTLTLVIYTLWDMPHRWIENLISEQSVKECLQAEVPPTLKEEVECRDFTEEIENSPRPKKICNHKEVVPTRLLVSC